MKPTLPPITPVKRAIVPPEPELSPKAVRNIVRVFALLLAVPLLFEAASWVTSSKTNLAAATVRSAEAERDRLRLDFTRQQELRNKAVISDRDFESTQAQLKVAEARAAEANERLKLVQEGPRVEPIRQARARADQARAAVALATTQLDNTRLFSPLTGTVLSHNIEPGEFVAPGTPVVTVAETGQMWVRAYLNQTDLGRLRHGQPVVVRTDSFPGRDFPGTVGFISSEAEFTPKTVQTPKERVKLVFRIKVDVANPKDELKPGMPADVIIPAAN